EEQQSALGSLTKVVLQNRRALNVITDEAGGVCALLCSFYTNTSGQVEEDLQILKKNIKLIEYLKERTGQRPSLLSNLLSSMGIWLWTWQLPLLGPLILIAFVLLFSPYIINTLSKFISRQVQKIQFQMVLQQGYQPVGTRTTSEQAT
ncbi:hypothetical protein DBR06_SOUSAS1510025, partial [Sousa chinensis]